jgi:hypothetical protein
MVVSFSARSTSSNGECDRRCNTAMRRAKRHRTRTCSALNLTRPIVSFSAIEMYWESESKPTYSASESRCWFTAHSLRSRQAPNELNVLAEGGQAGNGSGRSASLLFGGVRVAGAHILGLQVL